MVKLPEGKAKPLKQAFQLCDVGPLKGGFLNRFYVDLSAVRNQESISGVKTRLDFLDAGEFESVLFTGHRGCGKSTELRRLQSHWEESYRVIYLESDNEIDIHDADYTDLYLVIIKQITDDLAQFNLQHHYCNKHDGHRLFLAIRKSYQGRTSVQGHLRIRNSTGIRCGSSLIPPSSVLCCTTNKIHK